MSAKSVSETPILDSPKPRRRWRRLVTYVLLTLVVLVLIAPTVLSFAPCLNFVLRLATRKVHGTITTQGASLGWFSRPVLYGFEILPEKGPPLVQVPRVEGDHLLWEMVFHPSELGKLSIDKPEVRLVVEEKTEHNETQRVLNFAEVFPPPEEAGKPSPFLTWLKGRHLSAKVSDLTVHWLTPRASREWSMDRISVSGELQPAWMSESGVPELRVDKQTFLDRRELSPEMFSDLMKLIKYVTPTLAGATRVEGNISFALEECRLPLDKEKIKQGKLDGALTFHSVDVEGGKIITMIADLLKLPPEVELTHESVVLFTMHEGRIYHQGVDFGVAGVRVKTSGSVGVDQTLDLVAEVHVSASNKFKEERPLLGALSGQVLRLPIGGTLDKPEINFKGLGNSALSVLQGTLNALGKDGEKPVGELLQKLRDMNLLGSAPADGAAGRNGEQPAAEGLGAKILDQAVPVLQNFLKKRRERREERKKEFE